MTLSVSKLADILPEFMNQARFLIQGGELLPGGEDTLARKLQEATVSGKPLTVKLGLDPTRPDLHLGHSVVLRKLRAFQDLGHQAVLIIGDATALIGDPSGRNQTRPPLTPEEIQINAQTYLDQAGKIIDTRKAKIIYNNQWFGGLTLKDFLALSSKMTVAQMLARDDFNKRYTEKQPIALHELFYPLMQAYDSVMLEADIELGGSDQRFNNLLGREMQLAYGKHNTQLVLLMPLLEGTDGVIKMSKSYPEHCINLTDSPETMFGKLMSISDTLLLRYEALLTPLPPEQIEQQRTAFTLPASEGGLNPRDIKVHLAKWLIAQYYDQQAADQAEADFVSRFQRNELPEDMPEAQHAASEPIHWPSLMTAHALTASKSEAKRLIQGGGVKITTLPDKTVTKLVDPDLEARYPAGTELVLQVGKRKFLRLVIS